MRLYPYPSFRTGGPSLAEVLATIPQDNPLASQLTDAQRRVYQAFRKPSTAPAVAAALGARQGTIHSHIHAIAKRGLIAIVGQENHGRAGGRSKIYKSL